MPRFLIVDGPSTSPIRLLLAARAAAVLTATLPTLTSLSKTPRSAQACYHYCTLSIGELTALYTPYRFTEVSHAH